MAVNSDGLLAILDEIDTKHGDAHVRLRKSVTDVDQRVDRVDDGQKLFAERLLSFDKRLAIIETTPLDITKSIAPVKILAGVVALCVTIFGSMWAATSDIRSNVRDMNTRMEYGERAEDLKAKNLDLNNQMINRALEANTREMKESIALVTKRQEMLTLQYNQLNEQITRLSAAKER